MKLCYLSAPELPSPHANSVHVMKMRQAFARDGHDVTLIAARNEKDRRDPSQVYGTEVGFRIQYFKKVSFRLFGVLDLAFKTKELVQREAYDLMYGRSFAALYLLKNRSPFIYESHWLPKSRFHAAIEKRLFEHPNCQGFVVISDALKKLYLRKFARAKAERILVAHDGADLPKNSHRSQNEQRSGSLQVGYVGSLYPGRGIEIILELARALPHFTFHIVGGLPKHLAEWKRQGASLSNLIFHGQKTHVEVGNFLKSFDVVLAPYQANLGSLDWASPLKIFEYMSFKKAIICSDFPIFREVLKNEHNGLLVTANHLDPWKAALEHLQDPKIRERLGEAAYGEFVQHYQWTSRAKNVLNQVRIEEGRISSL